VSGGVSETRRQAAAGTALQDEAWPIARLRELVVAELFASLQGEGTRAGLPTVFLRLTGCALRCRWCDTEWAFHGGERRSLHDLASSIAGLGIPRVCVTGGEPLLQRGVVPLVRHLDEDLALEVVVETGGDQDISVLPPGVVRVMDIKLPGSGMEGRLHEANLSHLTSDDEVKLVVADRDDYLAARRWIEGPLESFDGAILLGAVHGELPPATLTRWVLEDRLAVRVQLQLHKLIWPGRDRGV